MKKNILALSALLAALLFLIWPLVRGEASAQTYPTKPITLMVGVPPGGGVDGTARRYADLVTSSIGKPVVVDNRSNQLVASSTLKNAAPDGYTLLVITAGPNTVLPSMQAVDFDPLKDFTYITRLAVSPLFLAVASESPVHSLKEMLDWARRKPGGLNYGIPVIGSPPQFFGAILQRDGNAPMTGIPFSGVPPTVLELVAGRLDWIAAPYGGPALAQKDAGKLRYLAIFQHQRSRLASDLPTMDEEGFSQAVMSASWGLAAPRGLPREIVDILFREFSKAANNPDLAKALAGFGNEVSGSPSPEEFTREIENEVALGAKLVKDFGFKIQ